MFPILCFGQKCISGNCENGKGTFIWPNGDRYSGEWKNNKMNGQGTLIGSEVKIKYVGEWKDNLMNGQGTFTWANGDKYVGEWKEGTRDGQGTFTWANGDKYVGEWRNSKMSDQGTFTDANKINNNNEEWYGNGSGFFISTEGYIATNHHVIEGVEELEVEVMMSGRLRKFSAVVVNSDPNNDLAIIKIEDSNFQNLRSIPYNFKGRSSDVGTEVFALGYPMALTIMGKEIKFTDGRISSKTGFQGDITTYQTTTPIQPGNSGGPLFDHNANLIGINSSGLSKEIADNVSYSIKTNYLTNLIDALPESIPIPSSTWIASKPLTEQIKILSKYVVLVKVK